MPGIPFAIRAIIALAAIGGWAYCVYRCIKAVENLRYSVSQMVLSRTVNYPDGELHPLLRKGSGEVVRTVTRMDDSGRKDTGTLASLPDPEEEKCYPYYNRTGQIVCSSKKYSIDQINTGSWYGYEQWLQDIVAGKSNQDLFSHESHGEEEVEEHE